MQKSKKFITAFLATIMVMSTAACGGNASQNSSSQQSAGVSSATSATGEEKTGYDTHVELSWFKEGITVMRLTTTEMRWVSFGRINSTLLST